MNTRAILAAACMIVLLAGCKQEENESCQIDDDCTGDLICCKTSPYAIETDRGICLTQEECDTRDATTDPSIDEETDGPDDPAEDDDPVEDPVEDPMPDPVEDPEEDPVADPEEDDAGEDDPSDETTD